MCTNVNPAPHSTPALIQQRCTHSTGMELIQNMLTGSARHLHQEHFFDFGRIFDCSGYNFGQILHFSVATQTLAIKF